IMMKAMPPALAASSAGLLDGSVSVSAYTKAAKGLGGEQAAMALQFLGLYKSSAGFSNILKTGGPAVQTYIGALGKAVGTSEGLSVALQLTGENAAGANKAIDAVAKASGQADGSIRGWDEVQGNFNQRLAEAEQGAKSFAIEAGQHLLPILTNVLGYVQDHGPAAMHDLGAAFHAAEVAAGPLIAAGGGVLHVFQELPGPMKDVVVALAALKVVSSVGLFDRTKADGTATSVGRLSAAVKTAAVSVGSLSSEMSVQQALFAAEARDAELAASGVGSLNRALGATAVAADAADAGLTRVQMMLRGYDVALAETVVAQDAANTGLGRIGAGGATLAARGFSAAKTAGSGLLSMLGGPWGVAIIGATVGIGAFTSAIQNHNKEVQADTDQVTSWYKAMAGGGRGAVDAMGQLRSKQLELAAAQAHLNDLETQSNDPLLRLSRSHAALGVAIGAQKQKIGELSGEVVKGKKAWDDYWNSLTPQQQAAQTVAADEANLALALQQHGAASTEVKNATADYNAALEHQKQLTGQLTAAEQTQIDKINQLATVQLSAVSSQLGAAQAQSSLDDALAQYNKDSGDGQHSTHQLAAESNSLAAQAISTAQAVAKQAVDQAAANGRTDDGTLANSVMLASLRQYATHITGPGHDALVKAINDLQHTTIATGNVQDAVSKMGLNVEATWDKNTRVISGATDQQIKDLQNLGIKVTHLPKGKIVVSTDTGPARAELDRLIAIYKGTTLTLAGNYHVAGLNGQPGGTQTKATGGPIIGPGTGTSDSVLIAASNGEHMWTAAETAAAGGHAGVAALRRAVLAGGGGRAAGGPIGHFDMYDTMPARLSASAIRQAEASIRSLAAAA
ncbi:MAG: phage tail tape measure protein, partial [Frankiales bacterium]|nr:phage tail tape measure protein [Frankiales bacterium]